MTRTLILMRHAKSSWEDPYLSDFERPLNTRGQRSAKVLGDWLRAQDLLPDQVISSSSTRTGETFEGLALDIRPTFTRALYHAGPGTIWDVLAQATGHCVLLLGHNPGFAEFAEQVVDTAPDHDRFWDYPTGATLVVQLPIDSWANARPGQGRATHFVTPRELVS